MTDKLPPPLLALFQPRPPLRYLAPTTRAPEDCKKSTISGVAAYLARAKEEQPAFEDEHPYNATECWIQRKWRQKLEKQEAQRVKLEEGLKTCMYIPASNHLPIFLHSEVALTMRLPCDQLTPRRIRKLAATRTELFSSQDSTTKSKKPTWNASLAVLVLLKEYGLLDLNLTTTPTDVFSCSDSHR